MKDNRSWAMIAHDNKHKDDWKITAKVIFIMVNSVIILWTTLAVLGNQ